MSKPKGRKMEGLGKHHSTTYDQRIVGHSLVQGLYVLLDRTCPLAPQLYRQAKVCEAEKVPFQSKIELMETLIREFEPVGGTQTHVLLDSWYCAKCLWHAAGERDFLITTGLKSNRWLRVADETTAQGWRWQKLSEYLASLTAQDFVLTYLAARRQAGVRPCRDQQCAQALSLPDRDCAALPSRPALAGPLLGFQ